MATTKIIPMHKNNRGTKQALKAMLGYIMNDKKTNDGELITTYECDKNTIIHEWLMTKSLYSRRTSRVSANEVVAYQIRQSFTPDEISPELANEIGNELAKTFTKGKFEYIVCTHIDKAHIHNHIIFNATAIDGRRKFRNFWGSAKAVRRLSDRICLENNLSIIENPNGKGQHYRVWLGDKKGKSQREIIRNIIDEILAEDCQNFDTLISSLMNRGYDIKNGKNIAIKSKEQKRYIRLNSLGDNYTEIELKKLWDIKPNQRNKVVKSKKKEKVNLLIDIQAKLSEGKGKGYEQWSKVFNLKQMAKTINFLRENNIDDYQTLERMADDSSNMYMELNDKIKVIENKMRINNELKIAIVNYSKNREFFEVYKKSGYSKTIKNQYSSELSMYENARKTFKELEGNNIPKIITLKKEYTKLLEKKKKLYSEYHSKKNNYQEIQKVKANVDSLLFSENVKEKKKENNKNR